MELDEEKHKQMVAINKALTSISKFNIKYFIKKDEVGDMVFKDSQEIMMELEESYGNMFIFVAEVWDVIEAARSALLKVIQKDGKPFIFREKEE